MELEDIDDDNPIKKEFLQKEKVHLLTYNQKNYRSTKQAKNKDLITTDDESTVSSFDYPPEIVEKIVLELVIDKDKETVPTLCYILIMNPPLSEKIYTQVRDKISVYHALYVIKKMEQCKTSTQRIALREIACSANHGFTYWDDLPNYSFWGMGLDLKRNIRKEVKGYIENSKQKADDLDKKLPDFFDELADSYESIQEQIVDDEPIAEFEEIDASNKERHQLIKKYFITRSLFLNDAHCLEGKFREKINKAFKAFTLLRYCAPLHCCTSGVSLCAIGSILQNCPIIFAGFGGLALGVLLCSCCCCCEDWSDWAICEEYCCNAPKIDYWENFAGIPNTQKYVTLAQKEFTNLSIQRKKDS